MKALTKVDLTDQAVRFAGDYIDKKFKNGRETEKSLILNTVAHGYFMGARHVENIVNKPSWMFWIKKKVEYSKLDDESVKAAKAYIKKKGFKQLDFSTSALIKASLGVGFREGAIFRKQKAD